MAVIPERSVATSARARPGLPHYDSVRPRSRAAWRLWLERHHASSRGVWLVMAKKHSGLATVPYNDAVEEALCFGWIDTTVYPVDERLYRQLFTPRKPTSTWAASNKARVERLIAQRLMTAAGMAAIETAKANGSWSSLDQVEAGVVPADLETALGASPNAARAWAALTDGARKRHLFWLCSAKRQNTRDARISAIIVQLEAAGAELPAAPATRRPATRSRTTTQPGRRPRR